MGADFKNKELSSESRKTGSSPRVVFQSELDKTTSRRNFLKGAVRHLKRAAYTTGAIYIANKLGSSSGEGAGVSTEILKVKPVSEELIAREAFPHSSYAEAKNRAVAVVPEMNNLDDEVMAGIKAIEVEYGRYFKDLKPEVANLFYGMMVQESSGNFKAKAVKEKTGEVISMGITSMTENMARAHNIRVTDREDDERLHPDKILPETVNEIKKAYGYWGDWGLAMMEWNTGLPRMQKMVNLYLADWHGITQTANLDYKKTLADLKIDANKILRYGKIVDKLNEWGAHEAPIYLAHAVAASFAYQDYKRRHVG